MIFYISDFLQKRPAFAAGRKQTINFSQFPFPLRFFNQRGEIPVMPVRRGFFAINVMEKTARNFLLVQVLLDTQIAALVMIHRMARTFQVRACAELLCLFHSDSPLFHFIPGSVHSTAQPTAFCCSSKINQPAGAGLCNEFNRNEAGKQQHNQQGIIIRFSGSSSATLNFFELRRSHIDFGKVSVV